MKISDFGLARYANSPDCHLLGMCSATRAQFAVLAFSTVLYDNCLTFFLVFIFKYLTIASLGKSAEFPIRWTAPEVFTDNVLSKASDVW